MLSTFDNFAASPVCMLLVLVFSAFFWGFLVRAVARRTLLPAVYRFVARGQQAHQQQQQEELDRQNRLRFYIDDIRRRAMAAAAAVDYERQLLQDREWLESMAESDCHFQEAMQAQEPAVAVKRAVETGGQLRRDLEAKLGLLEASDHHLEDTVAFAKHFNNEQHFRPERGSLLYVSDDEDPEVIRGDKKGKRNKWGAWRSSQPEGVL